MLNILSIVQEIMVEILLNHATFLWILTFWTMKRWLLSVCAGMLVKQERLRQTSQTNHLWKHALAVLCLLAIFTSCSKYGALIHAPTCLCDVGVNNAIWNFALFENAIFWKTSILSVSWVSHHGNSKSPWIYAKYRCICFAQGKALVGRKSAGGDLSVRGGNLPAAVKTSFQTGERLQSPQTFLIHH